MKEEKQVEFIKEFIEFPTFKESFVRQANLFAAETECWRFRCPNCDLEVSVIRSSTSFGGRQGLFEIAFMEGDSVCTRTELIYDVEGYLTKEDVLEYLEKSRHLYYDAETSVYKVIE